MKHKKQNRPPRCSPPATKSWTDVAIYAVHVIPCIYGFHCGYPIYGIAMTILLICVCDGLYSSSQVAMVLDALAKAFARTN